MSEKPINSSYYHGRLTTKDEDAERYKPQPLAPTPILVEETAENTQGSKWNKAQTFETTDFPQKVILRVLNEVFANYSLSGQNPLFISHVQSSSGYASRTFTRGKQCLTFELDIKFCVQRQGVDENGEKIFIPLNDANDAVIEFLEADFTDLEDFTIKYRNIPTEYSPQVKKCEDKLRSLLSKWTKQILLVPDDVDE